MEGWGLKWYSATYSEMHVVLYDADRVDEWMGGYVYARASREDKRLLARPNAMKREEK